MLKKIGSYSDTFTSSGTKAVTLEPIPGHSDEEVVESLHELGASNIQVLAPGFISAQADGDCLRQVEDIAYVHVKRLKASHA